MIDPKALEIELIQTRLVRLDAEAAGNDVEELIRQVQNFRPGRQWMVFMAAGSEPEPRDGVN